MHFEINPGALFSKLKKPKINQCLKTKTKTGKAINLKIYLLVCGQKLIFNLGIPLNVYIAHTIDSHSLVSASHTLHVRCFLNSYILSSLTFPVLTRLLLGYTTRLWPHWISQIVQTRNIKLVCIASGAGSKSNCSKLKSPHSIPIKISLQFKKTVM